MERFNNLLRPINRSNMGQERANSGSRDDKNSVTIKVTLDKSIWDVINDNPELGDGDSAKIRNICVAWLGDQGILSGIMKKRLNIK